MKLVRNCCRAALDTCYKNLHRLGCSRRVYLILSWLTPDDSLPSILAHEFGIEGVGNGEWGVGNGEWGMGEF